MELLEDVTLLTLKMMPSHKGQIQDWRSRSHVLGDSARNFLTPRYTINSES